MEFVEKLADSGIGTTVLGGDETLNVLQSTVHLPRGARILDVGSGGGILAVCLARIFDGEVTSIDRSGGMTKLSAANAERFGVSDRISFVEGDVMTDVSEGGFDLVAHRGIEVFFEEPQEITDRLVSLVRPLGFLVCITQTYESEVDPSLLTRLNAATGYNIQPRTHEDVISAYEATGMRLVRSEKIPVDPTVVPEDTSPELRPALELCAENDRATTGGIFVFRKGMFTHGGMNIFVSELGNMKA